MNFSNDWFLNSELRNILNSENNFLSKDNVNTILEIGSYEGAFSCFISNNYLNNEDSILVCVDPFDNNDTTSPVYGNIENRFLANIVCTNHFNKVILKKMTSDDFFKNKKNLFKFNFIYIDGSHIPEQIVKDFNNSLELLKVGGIIWLDDYLGGAENDIKRCIDSLYNIHSKSLEIVHKNYQIAFKKIK